MHHSGSYRRIFKLGIFVGFFLITINYIIWIICSLNFNSFWPIECILEPSELGNLFVANPVDIILLEWNEPEY